MDCPGKPGRFIVFSVLYWVGYTKALLNIYTVRDNRYENVMKGVDLRYEKKEDRYEQAL